MSDLFLLVKFGSKKNIDDLLMNGHIRFSPLKSFKKSDNSKREDKLETAFKVINSEFTDVKVSHPSIGTINLKPVPDSLGRITQFNDDDYVSFSSFAITPKSFESKEHYSIDAEMLGFGNTALMIKNPKLFFNRIKKALEILNLNFDYKLVNYIDVDKRGEIDLDFFTKDFNLSYQSEHRILVKNDRSGPLDIKIGSIEDISDIFDSIDIFKLEFEKRVIPSKTL